MPAGAADVHRAKRGRLTVTRLHRSGADPHRVLLLGSRAMLSPAGHAQADALGARITDRVWLRTRRGVDLDMVWELRPIVQAMRGTLAAWRLWRYDAVVVLAPGRARGLPAWWGARGLGRLLLPAIEEVAKACHVLLVSLEPAPGRAVPPGPRAVHRRTAAVDGSTRIARISTSDDVAVGADAIARHLLEPLAVADAAGRGAEMDAAHRRRLQPDDEERRQRALDDLRLRDRRMERRLQQVVDTARDTFGTVSAEITILDHDRQWTLAASGRHRPDQPRGTSLCSRAIQQPAATVIGDTWTVPELRGNPLVAGADAMRFYASHPIESLDGFRIGVLCVWDDVPHDARELDVSALRDLALLAEAEIITGTSAGR